MCVHKLQKRKLETFRFQLASLNFQLDNNELKRKLLFKKEKDDISWLCWENKLIIFIQILVGHKTKTLITSNISTQNFFFCSK